MGTRRQLFTIALLLTVFGAVGAVARAEVVQSGDVRVQFHAGFSPKALPRERPAPISVAVEGRISTTDGAGPPPLQQMRVELNSAGRIETAGLPLCRPASLQATSSEAALERCRPALVGTGTFKALLSATERHLVGGRALVFNGIVDGGPAMLIQIYISSPVELTLVIPIVISHQKGQFGTVLTTKVPKLAGGAASIVEMSLRIGRQYRVDGKRRSYLSAACAAPAGFPGIVFPFARGTFTFSGGRDMHSVLTRDCQVRK
jgi:hypothetical protein